MLLRLMLCSSRGTTFKVSSSRFLVPNRRLTRLIKVTWDRCLCINLARECTGYWSPNKQKAACGGFLRASIVIIIGLATNGNALFWIGSPLPLLVIIFDSSSCTFKTVVCDPYYFYCRVTILQRFIIVISAPSFVGSVPFVIFMSGLLCSYIRYSIRRASF